MSVFQYFLLYQYRDLLTWFSIVALRTVADSLSENSPYIVVLLFNRVSKFRHDYNPSTEVQAEESGVQSQPWWNRAFLSRSGLQKSDLPQISTQSCEEGNWSYAFELWFHKTKIYHWVGFTVKISGDVHTITVSGGDNLIVQRSQAFLLWTLVSIPLCVTSFKHQQAPNDYKTIHFVKSYPPHAYACCLAYVHTWRTGDHFGELSLYFQHVAPGRLISGCQA